jgi:hypothetical protein
LHGKDPSDLWESLRGVAEHPQLILCTDLPEVAKQHFSNAVVHD